jgi:hypothetical protein
MAPASEAGDYSTEASLAGNTSAEMQQNSDTPAEDASPKHAPALSGPWWLLLIAMVAALAKWLF